MPAESKYKENVGSNEEMMTLPEFVNPYTSHKKIYQAQQKTNFHASCGSLNLSYNLHLPSPVDKNGCRIKKKKGNSTIQPNVINCAHM